MDTLVNQAVQRIRNLLDNADIYDSDEPAEIIADVIHFCRVNDIDFDDQLRKAHGYAEHEVDFEEVEINDLLQAEINK